MLSSACGGDRRTVVTVTLIKTMHRHHYLFRLCGIGGGCHGRPLVERAVENAAVRFEGESTAALKAAVSLPFWTGVADGEAGFVLLFRNGLQSVGDEGGQRRGEVPGLRHQSRHRLRFLGRWDVLLRSRVVAGRLALRADAADADRDEVPRGVDSHMTAVEVGSVVE